MATTRRNAQRTTTSLNPLKPVNNNKNVGGTKRALEENGPETKRRRAAFGDLTNANALKNNGNVAKITKKVVKKEGGKKKTVVTVAVPKISAEKQISLSQPAPSNVEKTEMPMPNSQPEKETSFDYVELSQGSQSSSSSSQSSLCEDDFIAEMNEKNNLLSQDSKIEEKVIEPDWVDIDAEHMKDPFQCGLYSAHIFQYYKDREADFVINDYLSTKQKDLTPNMRAILVDWLVEVQENFELNHETLYLAVKLVDRYLCLATLPRDRLQLLGATCLFIACKFDERCPPVLDDFLYICDDAYKREELIGMEMKVLKTIDFDLGIPLSYRFLRRYAKCARVAMDTLTLARFILESSLMHYKFAQRRDSFMAAASLLLAMTMKDTGTWDGTMRHYTGYEKSEIVETVAELNKMIAAAPSKHLMTIRSKYSHTVFHKVALIAHLTPSQLKELGCPDLTESSSEKSSIINTEES